MINAPQLAHLYVWRSELVPQTSFEAAELVERSCVQDVYALQDLEVDNFLRVKRDTELSGGPGISWSYAQ